MATIRSTPPRRPRWPASVIRTSYQVGRPWMLDGKMLRAATGTPIRITERAKSPLALAEPEPLTLANLTTKSLTLALARVARAVSGNCPESGIGPRVRHLEVELLHVPGPGRAALGAQAAVQADVLVLGHHPAGPQLAGDVDVLGQVGGRRLQPPAQVALLLRVVGEGDAVHRADVDAGVALDAQLVGEHRLDVAVQAALRLLHRRDGVEAELDLQLDVLQRLLLLAQRHLEAVVVGD